MGTLTEKRNYGIDLLRILSMFMVVLLHVLGAGGILSTAKPLSLNYEIAWFLETMAYCAVNCYALISGYVGVTSKHKYSNIAFLWLQVAFYTVGIAAIYAIVSPDVWINHVIHGAFPVTHQFYWYFTAYFGLFFFLPVLNAGINALSERQIRTVVITLLAAFTIIPIFGKADVFRIGNGYEILWLMILYIVGAAIRKWGWFRKTKRWVAGVAYLLSVGLSWGFRYVAEARVWPWLSDHVYADCLINYTSPTIVAAAVALLVLFMNAKIRGKFAVGCIRFLAPLAFSVYIIHMHPMIYDTFINGKFAGYASHPWWLMLLEVFGTAAAIFLICAAIDLVRHYLFKGLKIKELLNRIEAKIRTRKNDDQ